MKWRTLSGVVSLVAVTAPAVPAQDARPVVFGTYFRCNEATETRADELYKEVMEPAIEKQKQAGLLTTHGWASHWSGGEWRRLNYVISSDLESLVKARNAYYGEILEQQQKEYQEFTSICSSHDDYIWQSVASSQPPDQLASERPPVGMSTYFECGSDENEADAIVQAAFAPVLQKHVDDKKINSWNWMRHMAGGKYRRILVFDGADHVSVLQYWGQLVSALNESHPFMWQRFREICPSHTDYVWDLTDN